MKKFAAATLALLIAFSLVGCDSFGSGGRKTRTRHHDSDDEEETEDTEETEETEATEETIEPEITEETEPTETEATPAPTEPIKEDGLFIPYTIVEDYDYYYNSNEDLDEYYSCYYDISSIRISKDWGLPLLADTVNAEMENREQYYREVYENEIAEIERNIQDGSPAYSMSQTSKIKMFRADACVLSYVYDNYYYSGGAHGSYGYSGETYDTLSGEILKIEDIADNDKLYEATLDYLAQTYSSGETLYEDYEDSVKAYFYDYEAGMNYNFVVTYDGLMLFFNPYELAPYAVGMIRVYIPYEGHESIFKRDLWTGAPENQIRPFDYFYDYETGIPTYSICQDIDNDSVIDYIAITSELSDNYGYDAISININGEGIPVEDFWGYSVDPYLLYKDGKVYVMILTTTDNDYSLTYLYEIKNCEIVSSSENSGRPLSMINPDDFQVYSTIQSVGTRSAIQTCKINSKGEIEALDNIYTITGNTELPTVVDINGKDVNTGKDVTIKSGSVLKFVATDNETFARFEDEKGNLIDVDFDNTYPQTLDGKDLVECFEEGAIVYAG